mmetsp:Transcript_13408/g.36859  ORF Transcript_13408/g.36859 Transcript_13408/m.36859 type:complete len:380 (-) Transcript_13408:84-1223(-)|eukprot:CAMPEP_0171253678 /NCGR_PEP_ID=MMETSP0790-20130122/51830_1 /TAXON_ID=2925 /ORGANISM="Alexandrium catenella, Strain OF101" /LENGTH=379 /DNA_ID=CAMNT_0011721517 /DNA_START=82 /DNA_END=1221 /DNA_ORIENTATION=+
MMRASPLLLLLAVLLLEVLAERAAVEVDKGHKHHHHKHHHVHAHHRRHHQHGEQHHLGRRAAVGVNGTELGARDSTSASQAASVHFAMTNTSEENGTAGAPGAAATDAPGVAQTEKKIIKKMKDLEDQLDLKEAAIEGKKDDGKVLTKSAISVNGPLPPDFAQRFSAGVADATGSDPSSVTVPKAKHRQEPPHGAAPGSEGTEDAEDAAKPAPAKALSEKPQVAPAAEQQEEDEVDEDAASAQVRGSSARGAAQAPVPVSTADMPMQRGVDVNAQMPYGDLEPFGREDTAQELTEHSISESNQMVDQLERAEVAEEKRAVFRALTRLRGAALTAFDGIARSQTGTIDEYNKLHQWRAMHPLRHLAEEESDVSKWAFPDF